MLKHITHIINILLLVIRSNITLINYYIKNLICPRIQITRNFLFLIISVLVILLSFTSIFYFYLLLLSFTSVFYFYLLLLSFTSVFYFCLLLLSFTSVFYSKTRYSTSPPIIPTLPYTYYSHSLYYLLLPDWVLCLR